MPASGQVADPAIFGHLGIGARRLRVASNRSRKADAAAGLEGEDGVGVHLGPETCVQHSARPPTPRRALCILGSISHLGVATLACEGEVSACAREGLFSIALSTLCVCVCCVCVRVCVLSGRPLCP